MHRFRFILSLEFWGSCWIYRLAHGIKLSRPTQLLARIAPWGCAVGRLSVAGLFIGWTFSVETTAAAAAAAATPTTQKGRMEHAAKSRFLGFETNRQAGLVSKMVVGKKG